MEHQNKNASQDGSTEMQKAQPVARSGRGVCFSQPLASSKLVALFLLAQQFRTASAAGLCHALSSIKQSFDLIGLIGTFGTTASVKSLAYSALNDDFFYVTGHVGPGSLSVASALFEASAFQVAHLLAIGGSGDPCQLFELGAPDGMSYIGLSSDTDCPVENAVGASIVREHEALWGVSAGEKGGVGKGVEVTGEGGRQLGREVGRDAKRSVNVVVLEVGLPKAELEKGRARVQLRASGREIGAVLGLLPLLLTAGVIAMSCQCREWFVAGLLAFGTAAMVLAVLALRLCAFRYDIPKVADGAPPGDCLVLDNKDPQTLHLILADEALIQALLQRPIVHHPPFALQCALFFSASMFYIYLIASILYMTNVSASGQLLYALANVIGLIADTLKASKNGTLGLATKGRQVFRVQLKDHVVFRNRTAAVAYVAKRAKNHAMLKAKRLLPCNGPVWETVWKELAEAADAPAPPANASGAEKLLQILRGDVQDGINEC